MDSHRFDSLTRSIFTIASRRTALSGVVAATLSAFVGPLGLEAKRKKKKKKKQPPPAVQPTCVADCAGRVCGSNGCDGSCGECISPRICQDGACVCPSTHRVCQGQCILTSQCCVDGECATGEGCFVGTCVNLKGTCGSADNVCTNLATCGGGACVCGKSMQDQTRCVSSTIDLGEDACTSDAQCATAHPDIPGVFC